MASKLWYYCDTSGQQQGPVADKDLVTEYNAGHINDACLIWSDSLADWTPFSQVDEVYAQIQQAKAKTLASTKISAAAPKFGMGAPAKSNLVEEMAKKSMESLQQQNGKTSTSANVWTKVVGADGYPYYTNNETHETTWDRPDGYHSDEEHVQEQRPVAEVKQLSSKTTAAKAPVATPAAAAPSSANASDIADLKALIASLRADLEQSNSSLRDTIKANEKAAQDKIQSQEKLIADLKADITSCKSELKDVKTQLADCQKSLSTMQASVKSATDSASEAKAFSQTQFKQIRTFAKALTDNLKE